MTTTLRRACLGTELGIMAAWLAFPAMATFYWRPGMTVDPGGGVILWLITLPFLVILAAPGAIILASIHAVQMEAWAPRARSIGDLRILSILLGLPLGVVNLALIFGALSLLANRSVVPWLELAPWLLPALAGGAGLGWGVTIGLTPGRAAPARTTARPRPMRKLRRDGPPFFDTRASRRIA